MTLGTSDRLRTAAFAVRMGIDRVQQRIAHDGAALFAHAGRHARSLARFAAAAHLAILALVLTTAWRAPDAVPAGAAPVGSMAWLHMALLVATGATVALLTLVHRPHPAPREAAASPEAWTLFLRQVSHELRTPLNAVIGFSDLMQNQLLGPLGNARYRDYARHIRDSGGRLLVTAEDVMAMTRLAADGAGVRREDVTVAQALRRAWVACRTQEDARGLELVVTGAEDARLVCDGMALQQALAGLLRDATAAAQPGDIITARIGADGLDLTLAETSAPAGGASAGPSTGHAARSETMGVATARVLLELQGATLTAAAEGWRVGVAFPAHAVAA